MKPYLPNKTPRAETRGNQTVTRRTIQGQRLAPLVLLSAEFNTDLCVFFRIYVAIWRLRIVGSSSTVNNVLGRPANQILAAFAGQFRQLRASIGRHLSGLLPLLNRLIGHAHLARHFGKRGKMSDCSFECGVVHISHAVRLFRTRIAQAALVTQEQLQLPQDFLAGIFKS